MKLLNDLAEVPIEEQRNFINSFEHIFCDMDGVIWHQYKPISGSKNCLDYLNQIGKKVTFVTNNSINSTNSIKMKLKAANFDTTTEIVNPLCAIIEYLKEIKFNSKIFAVATKEFKEELRKNGFSLLPDPPAILNETLTEFIENTKDDPEVGAVILDFDVNTTRLKLQKAVTYLRRKDCLFIVGACDTELPIGPHIGPIIGNYHFFQSIVDISGRSYFQISKPSQHFLESLMKRLGLQNSKNILVIGDSIEADMGLAAAAGCQKLLVLSGNTKRKDIFNWQYPEELKPEYYIDNLDSLKKVLENVQNV